MLSQRLNIYGSLLVTTTILLGSTTLLSQSNRASRNIEQVSFGSETPISKPVKLPQSVLEQLSEFNNRRLADCQRMFDLRESNISKHFAASALRMNDDNEQDLMVQAQTRCFMGAHSTTFWIFAKVEQRLFPGYDLIFSASTDWLEVMKTYTNGYRDIQTAGHTALEVYTTIWRFDGQKYQPRECTIEDLRTKKVVRVRCSIPE